ncbi:MAG TPA: nuclease [Thermoplasmata archaeon]|nr:nuclease [Thermoplasmata archaeon]
MNKEKDKTRMKNKLAFFVLLVFVGIAFAPLIEVAEACPFERTGYCRKVTDGSIIEVGGTGMIRLADIKTPEINEPGYNEAKEAVRRWCENKYVYLDLDNRGSKHGDGLIAVVYAPDWDGSYINLNQWLVKKGYAVIRDRHDNEFNPSGWRYGPLERVSPSDLGVS